jgi:hypothetical protein
MLFHGGAVFHACGIDDNGRGLLMVGHSGAGKSTQTGIWSRYDGVVAMNDDRVALRWLEGRPVIYGTPWGGTAEIARNHRADLAAVLILEQAPYEEILSVPPAESAGMLLARAFVPYWDTGLLDSAWETIKRLVAEAPVFKLRCRPIDAAVTAVRSVF